MGHPATDNRTPFALEILALLDEEARPLLTVVIKGTFAIGPDGRCHRAEVQVPVNTQGEPWGPDPATCSYRYEPEVAFTKLATDVILIGHAHAPRVGATEMMVGLRVGPVQSQALVTGDRVWFKYMGQVAPSKTRPFEKIPLRWEQAFGGWDRSHPDPARHVCEPRNPVGVGMHPSGVFEDGLLLPNIEDPQRPLRRFGDSAPPVGFGFVSPHWQPRAALAGTFDERWQKERAPLLPKNFDRRHLNAAPPGLIAPGHLRGDENGVAMGVDPGGPLRFSLPGVPPPVVRVAMHQGPDQVLGAALDTVIIEADERRLLLLWRVCLSLPRRGPLSVRAIEVSEMVSARVGVG